MVLMYLFCWAVLVISGLLFPATKAAWAVFLAALAMVSLNYKSPWLQKFAAVISIFALLLVLGFGIFVFLYHYAPVIFLQFDTTNVHRIINSLAVLLLSLALQKFKNLKKETTFSFSPKFYVISVAVPVASLVLLFLLVEHVDMPPFIELLTLFILFGINVLDIYLYNGLAGAH